MAISANSIKIIEYLKTVHGTNVTSADVAEALGMEKRTVDGAFTSAVQRKGLGCRVNGEVQLEDGSHKQVKYLVLNDAGLAFDPEATED